MLDSINPSLCVLTAEIWVGWFIDLDTFCRFLTILSLRIHRNGSIFTAGPISYHNRS